jgi:hypothetical protein
MMRIVGTPVSGASRRIKAARQRLQTIPSAPSVSASRSVSKPLGMTAAHRAACDPAAHQLRREHRWHKYPHTATSLSNLATVLKDQGDVAGARPLCERALAIYEKVLGAEHPDTATLS